MRELSLFIDESGSDNLKDRYYLLTLVLHEQDESIHLYEQSLAEKGRPDGVTIQDKSAGRDRRVA